MSAFVFRNPYRHFWPLPDEKSVIWSPTLAQTTCLEHPDLWPWLRRLREIPAEGCEVEEDLWPVARLLLAQGYLCHEPPPARLSTDGERCCLFWSGPVADPYPGGACQDVAGAATRTMFWGDGEGEGWCFWVEPGEVCLECQLRRWQAHRDLADALAEIGRGLRAWKEAAPVWEPPPPDWREIAQKVEERRQSLLWNQESRHWLRPLPLPHCGCLNADQAAIKVMADLPAQFEAGQWQALEPLGLVSGVYFQPPLCHARTGDLKSLGGLERGRAEGTGCHQDPVEAFLRARGEALERYCARWQPREAEISLPEISWQDFSPAQLRSADFPYELQGVKIWSPVTELCDAKRYRAPGQALLLETLPGEKSVYPNLSHGLCCHRTLNQALWGGIWECLERDAVAGFWAQLNSPGQTRARARRCQPGGPLPAEMPLLVYEIPCLMGHCRVAWWTDSEGRRAGGSAAGAVAEEVEAKAILEAYHNYLFLSSRQPGPSSSSPASFLQHLEYYWNRPQEFPQALVDKLAAPSKALEAPSDWRELAQTLKRQGYALYWGDLTTLDVRRCGFTVVKVFSPDLLYLPADHRHWPLARERYRRLSGHTRAPHLPHPFG